MATRPILAAATIGAAGTVTGEAITIGSNVKSLAVATKFLYGAGGTAVKVYIQTTLDGTNWFDIIQHAYTTAAGWKASAVSPLIAPASQAFTPAALALTDNTIIQGVVGDQIRYVYVSTGTYSGATSIAIAIAAKN